MTTFTGNVTITGANGAPSLTLDDTNGRPKAISLTTANSARWLLGADATSESGTGTGSDFLVTRYTNTGSTFVNSVPLKIERNTGHVSVGARGWLQSLIGGTEVFAELGSLSQIGGFGVLGATRTSDDNSTTLSDSAHGGSFFGINDNTGVKKRVHGVYVEARGISNPAGGAPGASGTTLGIEAAAIAVGVGNPRLAIDTGPYTSNPDSAVHSYWGTSGRSDVANSIAPATFATVYKGPVGYRAGIVFDYQALDPSGNRVAMSLPQNYRVTWTSGAYDTLNLSDRLIGLRSYDDSASAVVNFVRARASGADTQAGDQLCQINGYGRSSGSDAFLASLTMNKGALGAASVNLNAFNVSGVMRSVGLNLGVNDSFAPGIDNVISLGGASSRWATVFAGSGMINTSDARIKKNLGAVPDALLAAARDIEIVHFQYLDALSSKGDGENGSASARRHIGVVAQQVVSACERHGVDPFAWGFVGRDPWLEDVEETYEATDPVTEEAIITETVVELRDGVPTQIRREKTVSRDVVDHRPVVDEHGLPIADADGKPVTFPVPRTRMVRKVRTVSRQRHDENGEPMFLMNVRYSELAMLFEATRAAA